MTDSHLPPFPYGAVYFRKSNPPREDWARDYQTAAEDGMTAFRHWCLWGAVEVAPGVFDWDDYDAQLDLAAENGIKTIIAEMVTSAPEWAWRELAHARYEGRDGSHARSGMSGSCVAGGFPGLCLDNDDAREAAGRFLTELAFRYREHPGLGGYDVWNECNYPADRCYCPASAEKFRAWLREKYEDLKALGETWHRYSFASWEDVQPPRSLGPYPDVLDWLQFRIDNAYELMRWRVELIRELDPSHAITAHGVVGSLTRAASSGADDWRAASEVDSYGYTWGAARHGNEPWKQWHAVDLVRAACRGKRFWHTEAYAGPLWMAGNVVGRERSDGRIADPEHIRLWDMTSFAAGATGLMRLRWRPLLDGPLFGAFGAYGMDGGRTPRSEMTSKIAKWVAAPEQELLWQARPVQGEIGIIYLPETQRFCQAQQGNTKYFADSLRGVYQAFFDSNIQADWVHLEDIADYEVLYLAFPYMLSKDTADVLIDWVQRGGTLISEGCPGYFGDRGHVGVRQPNHGLDELFGAVETYVEFTPDLTEGFDFECDELTVPGSLFLQAYEPSGGTVRGKYLDGERIAVVENSSGEGRTLLIGTFPGYAYFQRPTEEGRRFLAGLLNWAGVSPHLSVDADDVVARLHRGDDATVLWIVNHAFESREVQVDLGGSWGPFEGAEIHWGGHSVEVDERSIRTTVDGRDAVIARLM
jgi:beta-galactosidase